MNQSIQNLFGMNCMPRKGSPVVEYLGGENYLLLVIDADDFSLSRDVNDNDSIVEKFTYSCPSTNGRKVISFLTYIKKTISKTTWLYYKVYPDEQLYCCHSYGADRLLLYYRFKSSTGLTLFL